MNGLLNKEQIIEKSILTNDDKSQYKGASYNLRIGSILSIKDKKYVQSYEIEPQGMVLLISEEEFKMPEDIIGYTTVKNSMSIIGLLALNIGIVDAGYEGPISSILINFGNRPYLLETGMTFLRMTFHNFQNENKKECIIDEDNFKFTKDEYYRKRKRTVLGYLDYKFLSLNKIKNEIRGNVFKTIIQIGTIIAILVALSTYIINTNKSEKIIENYELLKKEMFFEQKKNTMKNEIIDELKKELLKNKNLNQQKQP